MRACLVTVLALVAAGCGNEEASIPSERVRRDASRANRRKGQPDKITMDQILISFTGAYRSKTRTRTRDEARKLAYSLLDRIRSGLSFQMLKQEYSDDRSERSGKANGPYVLTNFGVRGGVVSNGMPVLPRANMEKGVADLGFALKVGEVGIADFDERHCKYGWHLLVRLK